MIWSDFSVRVLWVSGCISSGIGFIVGNDFWSHLLRFGWNLAGSVEIWPRFRWITTRSCRIWSGMLDILPETLKVSDIWSGMLNISLEILKVLVRVGLHGFWNVKPTIGPLGSGLTVRNSRSTTGVVGSGGSGSDLGGLARLSGSVGLLDSPSHCILENDRLSHMHPVEAKSFLKDNEFSSVPWQ